jgi:hypothetical protein
LASERAAPTFRTLWFRILDQRVRVACADALLADVILANHAISATPTGIGSPDLSYVVTRDIAAGAYVLACRTRPPVAIADIGELLFHYERDLTIALQERRPELLFVHAAALEFRGKAYLLAGESGNGKSTTAWGLLHHGFHYLSDELGPIDLNSMQVLAYPRALCLKRLPPLPYPLPAGALALGGAYHLPVQAPPLAGAHGSRDLRRSSSCAIARACARRY